MHPDPRSMFVNRKIHHANNMQNNNNKRYKKKKNRLDVPMTDIHKTTWTAWQVNVEGRKLRKPNAFENGKEEASDE